MAQPQILNTNIAKSVVELIGNTPLLEVGRFAEKRELAGTILVKLEYRNPAGSIKDRIGYALIVAVQPAESPILDGGEPGPHAGSGSRLCLSHQSKKPDTDVGLRFVEGVVLRT